MLWLTNLFSFLNLFNKKKATKYYIKDKREYKEICNENLQVRTEKIDEVDFCGAKIKVYFGLFIPGQHFGHFV